MAKMAIIFAPPPGAACAEVCSLSLWVWSKSLVSSNTLKSLSVNTQRLKGLIHFLSRPSPLDDHLPARMIVFGSGNRQKPRLFWKVIKMIIVFLPTVTDWASLRGRRRGLAAKSMTDPVTSGDGHRLR
jgi:hypothetical protein